jgi:enoyl-CoA hydratase/carnithine racemase
MSGAIDCQREGAVVTVRLRHSGKLNAMSRAMWRTLRTVFEGLQADLSVRCVVILGADGHFCSGGDIAEYPDFRFDIEKLRHFHEQEVWGALQAMRECDVPMLALIEGNCMGAGLEIASCCDVRWACSDARFGAPIARLGFPMAPREAELVSQATGLAVARAMLLAAEIFDAAEMLRTGFLGRVLPVDDWQTPVQRWTAQVQRLAPHAARKNKQTLRELTAGPMHPHSDPYAYADTAEHREGIAAFLEKRRPQF